MKQTSLLVEFLIIGYIGLLIIGGLTMILLKVEDFDFLDFDEKLNEIILISGTVFAYIIGTITHRISQVLNFSLLRKVYGKIAKKEIVKPTWNTGDYVLVLQNGSENVLERVFYAESLLRIFKSIAILLPILGAVAWIWISTLAKIKFGFLVFSLLFGIGVLSLLAFRIQASNRNELVELTAKQLKEHVNS